MGERRTEVFTVCKETDDAEGRVLTVNENDATDGTTSSYTTHPPIKYDQKVFESPSQAAGA